MSDWQPIETAPKDGRFILLSLPLGEEMFDVGQVTLGSYWPPDEDRDERGT